MTIFHRPLLASLTLLTLLVAYHTLHAQDAWGKIKGQVVFAGDIPAPVAINMGTNKDAEACHAAAKEAKQDLVKEDWVINKENKGIRWAVVFLVPEPPKPNARLPIHPDLEKVSAEPIVVDQPACRFEPHVVGVRQGQTVVVKNSASFPHNVKWSGINNPGNNVIIPPGGQVKIDNLKAAVFPVEVQCSIHPWMKGYFYVFNHPYFAVTDANGAFEIDKAPAGNYRLAVWQESIGWKDGNRNGMPITIKANDTTDLGKIELKPKK